VVRPVQADFRELPAHPATTREFKQIGLFDFTGIKANWAAVMVALGGHLKSGQ
jgi:hypothetical protein